MIPNRNSDAEPKKVLVVDDEKFVRDLIRIKLVRSGLTVLEAENGLEALEIARDREPDIILMDLMMPKMNGFEACERLKADPRTSKIPLLFLSARSETATQEKARALGASGFLTKPFSPQKLAELVVELLNQT